MIYNSNSKISLFNKLAKELNSLLKNLRTLLLISNFKYSKFHKFHRCIKLILILWLKKEIEKLNTNIKITFLNTGW